MKVLKFGGSSVGNAERIRSVLQIIRSYYEDQESIAVVFSAFQGVTDKLLLLANTAMRGDSSYFANLHDIRLIHVDIAEALSTEAGFDKLESKISELVSELKEIVQSAYTLRELTPRIQDMIASFGERLSCTIISEILNQRSIKSSYVFSADIIKTDNNFSHASVLFDQSNKKIVEHFRRSDDIQIVTGFIGSTLNGEITTLGRGGSDYTVAILGAALDAEEIEIWTDVDGIMTADPRKVKDSIPLKAVTFHEAMEMSHFGAKVIYPPTMQPALKKNIKIRIRNTFNPEFKGTLILPKEPHVTFSAKGISSIDDITILRIEGSGLVSKKELTSKIFAALAHENIPPLLITQGSSGFSVCVAISPQFEITAKSAIEHELRLELFDGVIDKIEPERNLAMIAVVGEDMHNTRGISGRVFNTMGRNGINIVAIAQGSSELNISFVIKNDQLTKALNALHDSLFLSQKKVINIFIVGPGHVGSALLGFILDRSELLKKKFSMHINVAGIANSRRMIFDPNGLNINSWRKDLLNSKEESDIELFINTMRNLNLANAIFIDATASDNVVPYYSLILNSSISIITPNKIANTKEYKFYRQLREDALKNNVQFKYATNVGAGLPIINSLQDLVNSGEEILKIEGVLSGTLGYIFNSLNEGKSFSESVKDAKEKGFTEPDPRDDLNGLDVARKLLIMIREIGINMEMKDIQIESLVSAKGAKARTTDEFIDMLKDEDHKYYELVKKAKSENKVLRYVAKYENEKAEVAVEKVSADHPFYRLKGVENITAITTSNHSPYPLVLRGKGAGADYTAFGIFTDIIKVSQFLG